MHVYEWGVLRVVPRVERGEFVNAGVMVYCQALDFLAAEIAFDEDRWRALDGGVDAPAVRGHLTAARDLCAGASSAGVNGARPAGDRFRWLTAPRSTVLQPSPVHTGLTTDPAAQLATLFASMVRPDR